MRLSIPSGNGHVSRYLAFFGRVISVSKLSIVTPAYNESANLPVMYERLVIVLDTIDWEWIIVDDNSKDETFSVITKLSTQDNRVKGARLLRNAGSHLAICCGLELFTGDCVAIMAADLEDPPEVLPDLLNKWDSGAQVVWATRKNNFGKSLFYRFIAQSYHVFTRKFVGLSGMPKGGADMFLMDSAVADHVKKFKERNLSLFALVAWLEIDSETVSYEKQARLYGLSGWTFAKRAKLVFDTLVSFSHLPLRLMGLIGIISVTIGFVLGLNVLWNAYFGSPPEGWTSLAVIILFLGGAQIVMIGIIGEYLWRTLDEARSRPRYLVDKLVGDFSKDIVRL